MKKDNENNATTGNKNPKTKIYNLVIQGKGALLVKGIEGDYYTVMGLPVAALKKEIEKCSKF